MFIQVIQGRCRDVDAMHRQMDMWRDELEPGAIGWLGGTYGVDDSDEFIGVVRFDSRESAERNSMRPEQDAWWQKTSMLFDGDVTFHDCDDVQMMLDGGSDRAGFVQIIQGRISDPQAFRMMMDEPMDMMHQARPEIIGGTVAIDKDGYFTQTMSFTTEAEAREGEKKEMPAEMMDRMADMNSKMGELTYHDLHHPWFASAGQH